MATTLNISANTVLKTSPGKVVRMMGVSGVPAGTLNDAVTIGAGSPIVALPAIGQTMLCDWPCFVGITINISAGAVSVYWE